MTSFPIIQRLRAEALVRRWVADPLVQVQSSGAPMLARQIAIGLDAAPDDAAPTIGALGRRGLDDVLVVHPEGRSREEASVWVRASYGGYRAAYLAFLRTVYAIRLTSADLEGYDVDHLLNRARSPGGEGFIRLEAIPAAVNQAWGRLFEKTSSDPGFYANRHRRDRTMSWMICAKLSGQLPPQGPQDAPGITRLVRFFTGLGLDEKEAREGLRSMLDFAYRRA